MKSTKNESISVVLPTFNEAAGINDTIKALEVLSSSQPQYFEFIFVDDGSRDNTANLILKAQNKYFNIKLVQLSRNFGQQIAITAGLRYATGDAVVVMDADLQDPPTIIPKMIAKWHEGYDVVYGQRILRKGETFFKKFTAAVYYRLLQAISSVKIPKDTGDFRLMDRRVVQQLRDLNEPDPYVRGLVSWVGFKQTAVRYERQERMVGNSKYPLRKMFRLAWNGITSFSDLPLQLPNWLGSFSLLIGIIYLLFSLTRRFSTLNFIVLLVFVMSSLMFFTLGVMGTYLGRIFDASRNRPLYIVANVFDSKKVSSASNEQHKSTVVIDANNFQSHKLNN